MGDSEKKARQFRYINKKKAQGFQYMQTWISVEESNANKLKIALTCSSSYDMEKFIDNYFEKPLTCAELLKESMVIKNRNKFSNDSFFVKRMTCLLLLKNRQISSRKLSQILFNQYKLCSFARKTNEPSPINPGTISKIVSECNYLIDA